MTIEYQGSDITGSVEIKQLLYSDRAGGESDQLDIIFSDPDNLWPGWSPQEGDTIRVKDDGLDTGIMYLDDIGQMSGVYRVGAVSAKPSLRSNDWRAVHNATLHALAHQCATRHGLNAVIYSGVPVNLYGQMYQDGQTDMEWICWLAMLNSCAIKVYDGNLRVYHEPTQEHASVNREINLAQAISWDIGQMATRNYAACIASGNGLASTFRIASDGKVYKLAGLPISVYADADRYARGLLRAKNKYHITANVVMQYDTTLMSGIVVQLSGAGGLAAGQWFLDTVTHAPQAGRTALRLRKPLDGY